MHVRKKGKQFSAPVTCRRPNCAAGAPAPGGDCHRSPRPSISLSAASSSNLHPDSALFMQPLSGRPPNTTIAQSRGKAPLFAVVSVTSADGFLCYAPRTYLAAERLVLRRSVAWETTAGCDVCESFRESIRCSCIFMSK